MSSLLAGAKTIVVTARLQRESLAADGQMLDSYGTAQAVLMRPNRLYTATQSDSQSFATWYDGAILTVYDPEAHTYAQRLARGDDDAMIDVMQNHLDLPVPLAPFLLSDPYASISENEQSVTRLGPAQVGDSLCEHLALRGPNYDWQLWVTIDDEYPLPARMTVLYKKQPGQPRLTVEFLSWDLNQTLPAAKFRFTPPPGSTPTGGRM